MDAAMATMEKLSNSMGYVGPVANSLGYEIEEVPTPSRKKSTDTKRKYKPYFRLCAYTVFPTEEYGAKFFGNGARPGGVLEHPGILKDPEKLRESWNKVYQGTRNSHKVAVLEEAISSDGGAGNYRRHQQYNAYKKYYIWVCKRHENTGKENCGAKPISEEALERAFVRVLNGLIENREETLAELQSAVVSQISDSCESEIAEVDAEIQNVKNRIVDLLMDKNSGRLTENEYERQTQLLKFQIDELNLKKEIMLNEQGRMQLAEYRADAVTELLRTGKILDEFDKTIFKSLVRRIKVVGEKKVEIEFECGIKVTESL